MTEGNVEKERIVLVALNKVCDEARVLSRQRRKVEGLLDHLGRHVSAFAVGCLVDEGQICSCGIAAFLSLEHILTRQAKPGLAVACTFEGKGCLGSR